MNSKILAFYLPQYYETEYNNVWWGEGYTDWVATRNATPLFKGHNQPRAPKDNRYYDLSEESAETIKWQCQLAKEAGIYGFCIYHYWFPTKQLLEVPVQILRKHTEIDMPYCFCWDPKTWRRNWFHNKYESEVLLQQDFGGIEVWTQHYADLRDYFRDTRYIKIDNKPVFHIYKCELIDCLVEMKQCWDELARADGYAGVYLIAGDVEARQKLMDCPAIDAFYNYEPQFAYYQQKDTLWWNWHLLTGAIKKRANRLLHTHLFPEKRKAKWIYRKMAEADYSKEKKKVYLGTFSEYDDTPRRGMKGCVYTGNSPRLFQENLIAQLEKSRRLDNEFLYITAWNEWGESATLEPDISQGNSYLNCIKQATDEQ